MPKILLTVTTDLSYDQRMIRICRTLADAGYEVTLIGRKQKQSIPLIDESFQQLRLRCWFNKGKLFYLEYNLRLFFLLLWPAYDVLCSVDLDTLLAGYLATRIRRKKWVYDAHEYFTELPEVVHRPAVKKVWSALADGLVPRVDAAYTVGGSLARIFSKQYGLPFETIRNLPNRRKTPTTAEEPLPWDIPKERALLLYQGALNEGRGLEALIQVMKALPEAELWLAGEGDLSQSLRALSRELSLEDRVRFLGKVSPVLLQQLTPHASIGFNLLANKGLNYYYSLANKAFDYIQAGVPTIQMNFPEYQVLNEQFEVALLVNDLEEEVLLLAIKKLLEDDMLRQRLIDNCLAAGEVLCWEKEAKRLIAIYQGLFY